MRAVTLNIAECSTTMERSFSLSSCHSGVRTVELRREKICFNGALLTAYLYVAMYHCYHTKKERTDPGLLLGPS